MSPPTPPTRYEPNTVLDVTIRGKVADSQPGAWVLLTLDDPDTGIKVHLGKSVTVTVVAPPEWPPIHGDVWVDRFGNPLLVDVGDNNVLIDSDRYACERENLLKQAGPLRLVYRKNPTGEPA